MLPDFLDDELAVKDEITEKLIANLVERRKKTWIASNDIVADKMIVQGNVEAILSDDRASRYLITKPYYWIELAFSIVDKEKNTVPFFFNDVQKEFMREFLTHGTKKPYFILKGRQQGFTSLITAIQLSYAISQKNFAGFTVANIAGNATAIFNDKAKVVYDMLPKALKPDEKYNSKYELFFDVLNSSWRVETATKNVGRSRTLSFLHLSEVAFFQVPLSEVQTALKPALTKNSFMVYETTANGFNASKDLWDSGSCINLFFEWWKTKEYTLDSEEPFTKIKDNDTWIQDRIKWLEKKGLTRGQIAWYVDTYNHFVDKAMIRQEYPCTPEEAFIASGDCYFDKEALIERIDQVRELKPLMQGYFIYDKHAIDPYTTVIKNIRFIETDNGYIRIYQKPQVRWIENGKETADDFDKATTDKVSKKPYAIGGDTAGDGSDFNTAKVIDNITMRTVASMQMKYIADDLYADQVYCLGKYYHDAIIGIETNFSIVPTLELVKAQYQNLYKQEKLDTTTGKMKDSYGFLTTQQTRHTILQGLLIAHRNDPETECDLATLQEMLSFVRNKDGKAEATAGKHDDMVMCTAIAHFVARQGETTWKEPPKKESWWSRLIDKPKQSIRNEYISWSN